MNTKILIAGLIVAMCLTSGIAGWTLAKRASDRGVIKHQEKEAKEVFKHEEKKDVTSDKVRTIIRTRIKTVVDPSGCLDSASPPGYLDGLLSAESEAKSGFN